MDKLSIQQKEVLDLICNKRKNIFLTGAGGTGKSFLLRIIIQKLKEINLNTLITASTGIAASNIGGYTIHSCLGLNYNSKKEMVITKKEIVNNIDILIIDEISMISSDIFDIISNGISDIKGIDKPFGGIQVLFVGDFFQLPPVPDIERPKSKEYAFESIIWKRCIDVNIELKLNFRQNNSNFLNVLNNIRKGKCSVEDEKYIKYNSRKQEFNNYITPTKIYTKNIEVNLENEKCLDNIKSEIYNYKYKYNKYYGDNYQYKKDIDAYFRSYFKDYNITNINLKIGAQIVITRNITNQIVNGIRGVVIGFEKNYKLDKNKVPNWKKRIYLKLNKWIGDNNNVLPIVKLENNQIYIVEPEQYDFDGIMESKLQIIQLPLKLGYALTVHKCQGMTIDKCILVMNSVFSAGQIYVALSRIKNLENCKIHKFNRKNVFADPKCISFYESFNKIKL